MTSAPPIEKRAIHGILLVDKPLHLTSNAVLQKVKRLFHAKKAGHTGSLDPLATGMLPICFGEATKFSQYLLDANKCYEVRAQLGVKTNTGDAAGEVIAQVDEFSISEATLRQTLAQFTGHLTQVPSMFSALKHQGRPLYQLARAGIEIERPARPIIIHALELHAFDGRTLALTVLCSKGTYIRNLVEDIGDALGVGAYVTQLHRRYTAGFEDLPMYSLERLAEDTPEQRLSRLRPIDHAISSIPKLTLESTDVQAIRHGQTVAYPSNQVGLVRLYTTSDTLIGLGETDGGFIQAKRLLAADIT